MSETLLTARQPGTTTRQSTRTAPIVAVALSALSLIVLLARNTDDGPIWRVTLIVGATVAVLAVIIFGFVVPRTLAKPAPQSASRAALILGVLAVLSNVAFWMAVPPVFGVAAVALAMDARDRRPFRRDWIASLGGVLGALGAAAGLVLSCIG